MAPNLVPGTFKIVSLAEGKPVGVNLTRPSFQKVYLNAPVTTWSVEKAGDNSYRFSIGGYAYSGVAGSKIMASSHPEQHVDWIATYREIHDAYTIAPVDDQSNGWIVLVDEDNAAIVTRPIAFTRSIPPIFLRSQLFRFESIDGPGK